MSSFANAVSDGRVVAWRNLKRVPRIPELAIFAILQSIMFVLLFAFVFGGAIPLPGYTDPNAYREYLMPGIFAQTIAFASATTAIGMTDDMAKGIIDRFRSLPMARSAVLTGRSFADVIYNAGILIVLMISGWFVGWTVRTDRGDFVLDNMRNKILLWSETEYRYLKRQSSANAGKWVKLQDGRADAVGSVK